MTEYATGGTLPPNGSLRVTARQGMYVISLNTVRTGTVGPLTPTPFSDLPQPGSWTEPDPNGDTP